MHWTQKLVRNRIVHHILFWLLSGYLLFKIFNISQDALLTDLVYTILFHFSLALVVYTNVLLLIPKLFQPPYYLIYILVTALLLLSGVIFNQWTFNYLADWVFPGYYFISYYEFKDILQFMAAYWAISTLLKLSKAWFVVNEKEQQIQLLEKEKTQAELQALKAQFDPHFLFNSLNNIYSLSLYEDKKAPDALLKLAQTMRYVLYDCQAGEIELTQEIEQINNYIDIQRLRTDTDREINWEIFGNVQTEVQIAPLLLLPLVENAFKHVRPSPNGRFFVQLTLKIDLPELSFKVHNSRDPKKKKEQAAGGVGLQNLKQRLKLLYPNRHALITEIFPDAYCSTLKLQLQ